MELEPYSIEDSQRAAGFGSFEQAKKRKIETQTPLQDAMDIVDPHEALKKLKSE